MPKNGEEGLLCKKSNMMGTTVTQLCETGINVGVATAIGYFLGNPIAGISQVAAKSLEAASTALAGVINCGICVSECCCAESKIRNKMVPRRQSILRGEDRDIGRTEYATKLAQWKMSKAAADRCCRFGLSVAANAALAPVFGVDPATAVVLGAAANAPAVIACCTTDIAVICCTDNSIEEHMDYPAQAVAFGVLCCMK